MPGMVKDFRIPQEKDLQLNSADCHCHLSNSIKKRLEHGDQANLIVNSEEKWKLYPKLNKLPASGGACEFHLRQFADYIGLRSKGIYIKKLQDQLCLIDRHKKSLNTYLSTKEAAPWLKWDKNIEYVCKHANLGASKYLPKPITPEGRFDLSGFGEGVCYGVFNECIENIRSVGAGVVKYANLKWLLNTQKSKGGEDTSLFSKVIHEFNQFEFHCRFDSKATKGYALLNKVYGVV
jgi:hypothetical protein